MFKKPFSLSNAHKVSGADRKKLRKALAKKYPALADDDEALNAVLPNKAGELELAKFAAPSRAQLYLLDGQPAIVDSSGKGDYFPTCFTLWRCPAMVPAIYVKHPAVTQYVIGGADLMIPGVAVPPGGLPQIREGTVVSVCVAGNPAPVAVGVATMSDIAAKERISAGAKGKLVEMLQSYGDQLWKHEGNATIPNNGFYADCVVPLDWKERGEDDAGESGGDGQEQQEAEGAPGTVTVAPTAAEAAASAWDGDGAPAEARVEEVTASVGAVDINGMEEGTTGNLGAEAVEDMDDMVETCLLQALHKRVKDDILPITASVLWSGHMLPCRPPGSHLDIKKTKHKKLTKFLQSHGKNGTGLLEVKEGTKGGEPTITRVNREHEIYTYFRPYRMPTLQDVSAKETAASGPAEGELVMEELYRANKEPGKILAAVGQDPNGLFTASQCREAVFAYVQQQQLQKGARSARDVLLDPMLCDALFKGVLKKGEIHPEQLPKAELAPLFLKRMLPQWISRRGDATAVKRGSPPQIQVTVAKRQGNKRVTMIQGMEQFLVEGKQLAGVLQKKFACSTGVNELDGVQRKGKMEVVVQGNIAEKIGPYLTSEFQIPKRFIQVKNIK